MEILQSLIELANTQGGTIATAVIGALILLLTVPTFSKRMAEARKIEAETKKIRAQGDADTDLADTKNAAKMLEIMERQASTAAEFNHIVQVEFEKRREESERQRETNEKVASALKEFNTENKAWRFDFKTNSHLIDGSLLGLTSKVDGMVNTLEGVKTESSESHTWVRETVADMHDKIATIHTQVAFMHKMVVEAARKPDPTPPTEPASATPPNVTPMPSADAGAQDAAKLPKAG